MSARDHRANASASTREKGNRMFDAKRNPSGRSRSPRRLTSWAIAAALSLAALGLVGPTTALGAPALSASSTHYPAVVPLDSYAEYRLSVRNTGDEATSGPVTATFSLPSGMTAETVVSGAPPWNCSIGSGGSLLTCTGPESPIGADANAQTIVTRVHVDNGTTMPVATPTLEACGGGAAACATFGDETSVAPSDYFAVDKFDGGVFDDLGNPQTQAGSVPDNVTNSVFASSLLNEQGFEYASQEIRDIEVELPRGFVGNPLATPTCSQAQLQGFENLVQCPAESQVGLVEICFGGFFTPFVGAGNCVTGPVPVFNMERPKGTPAVLGFNILSVLVSVYPEVRTGQDYGLTMVSKNQPQPLAFRGVDFVFWGVPADPSHDGRRVCPGNPAGGGPIDFGCPTTGPLKPFLTVPTACEGPVRSNVTIKSWPGASAQGSFLSHDKTEPVPNPIGYDGCNALQFEPAIEARPTTTIADSASGLDVDLAIPHHDDCTTVAGKVNCETATPHLRDATVTLPEGLVINPAGANGLDGCSLGEFGYTDTAEDGTIYTTPDPAACPDASRQGNVTVETPLLDHPINGSIYLADPYANPFNSLLAIYVSIDDPESGIVIKLAGEVEADPTTGRLTTTFKQNPALPFEHFKLHFFGGASAPLRTPATCGTYMTTSSLTPWSAPESGPPAAPSDPWAIETAPGGGSCPTSAGARPNSPNLDAGSVSPVAGISTPTVVNLRRDDGTQEFSQVNLTLPPGLTGKLAGVGQCSDGALANAASKSGNEEKSSPSCPANSRVGTVDVGAGAGPAPYYTKGTVYLAGPYKGAPLSMAIVTPATAGPFDLGTVVVRVALFVDRNSARITAVSDPLPTILQGIPLDIRSAKVTLDRENFTRNGTSCNPFSFEGNLVSILGQNASLSERFQLGECSALAFKPKLAIRLFGGTKRGGHPALRASLQMPPGGANIASASVALPRSEFLDQSHIGTVCTRVQFAAKECPAASIYGSVVATSPLVDYPLEGNAYLRSSNNKLPDLVMALHGPPSQPVEVDAVGRIDSVKGGIRTSFDATPDIPVSSLVLNMAGGKKGLLENSTNICKGKHKAAVEMQGQNGKVSSFKVPLRNGNCGKARKGKKAKKGKGARRGAASRNAR